MRDVARTPVSAISTVVCSPKRETDVAGLRLAKHGGETAEKHLRASGASKEKEAEKMRDASA